MFNLHDHNAREIRDPEGPAYHAKTFHLPQWDGWNDKSRIRFLRQAAEGYGRDPRLRELVINEVLRPAGVEGRDYKAQAAAILKWVQTRIMYVNEPGEQLQSPWYTLKVKFGDCDDMSLLLASMYQSVRLPWKYVLSGRLGDKKVRWVEGDPIPSGARWAHIYVAVGWPPFIPQEWAWAEPTIKNAPLGFDTVDAGRGKGDILPELRALGMSFAPGVQQVGGSSEFLDKLKAEIAPHRIIGALVLGLVSAVVAPRIANALLPPPKRRR